MTARPLRHFLPWILAAVLGLIAAFFAARTFALQSEATFRRQQLELTDTALQAARQQLEAERIVTRRQLELLQAELQHLRSPTAADRR